MRNGARPRRSSPVAAPGMSQPPGRLAPEARSRDAIPLPDQTATQPSDDIVELLVRVPVEALEDESTGEPGLDGTAGRAKGAAARADRSPAAVHGGGSEPGDDFLELVESAEAEIQEEAVSARPVPHRSGGKAAAHHSEQIRFARLHLRTGSLLQARSEFEALAACDLLDVPATLDLAEVRWRTGDLMGAGAAAASYLAARGEEALGFLIAAEAAAADDRVIEARQHAARALERSVSNIEGFFAGVPRRMSWPESSWTAPMAVKVDAPAPQAPAVDWPPKMVPRVAADAPVEAPVGSLWAPPEAVAAERVEPVEAAAVAEPVVPPEAVVAEPAVAAEPVEAAAVAEPVVPPRWCGWSPRRPGRPTSRAAEQAVAAEPAAANPWDGEIRAGAEALASGDALLAALHFAVALRTSPEAARAVLDGIGERADLALELVRVDALRLLGNESDAGQAYASVASQLGISKPVAAAEPAPEPAAEPAPSPTTEPAPGPAAEPATRANADEQPRSIKWE